ncbi:hypothetical protein BURK1_03383 [Burkholderiales bacterium]|nr:hypothetical protein BURK1_03383 [Burkholderiales bacterium]
MNRTKPRARPSRFAPAVLALALAATFAVTPSRAEPAKGTVTQGGRSAAIRHAWLVTGTDVVTNSAIRMVVLSATDLGAKLEACATMSCVSGLVEDGMTVDFDAGPRLNFWVSLNGQRVQYSGTERPAAFAATASDAKRIAGRLVIDKSASGGAKVDVEFDAPLARAF